MTFETRQISPEPDVMAPDGSFTYDPPPMTDGFDNCMYTASDGFGGETIGAVEVEIENEPPTDILIDNDNVDENSPMGTLVGNLTAMDADNPGDNAILMSLGANYFLPAGAGDFATLNEIAVGLGLIESAAR